MANTKKRVHRSGQKTVTLKRHHAKPYRKRHIGLLVVSILGLLIVAALLIQYRDRIISGFASSNSFVNQLFPQNKNYDVTISSTYGYQLSYDQKNFYGSALSGSEAALSMGSELSQKKDYTVVRLAPNLADVSTTNGRSSFTLTYHPGAAKATDPLEAMALEDGGLKASNLSRSAQSEATIDGQQFTKVNWEAKVSEVTTRFVTYYGIVKGSAVTIVIAEGIDGTGSSLYDTVLSTLKFDLSVSVQPALSASTIAKTNASKDLLDLVMNSSIASAASNDDTSGGSEKVAALYSPAVVKVYNAFCTDVLMDGKLAVKDACLAGTGSGFFVSSDGYVATNGHVVATNAQDILISTSIGLLLKKGDSSYINALLNLSGFKASDVPSGATDAEALAIMIDSMYSLSEDRFTKANDVSNLFIGVTKTGLDIQAWYKATQAGQEYSGDSNGIAAKLVADDYRLEDGYDGFKASDVALLKVDGSNFPVTKLGSIDSVSQGSNLFILGYPGNATNNGIVESTASEATLTTGKVSSKKNAAKSDKMLIETDTTIGHGNSGGPALDDSGEVVGIATYTADGAGQGDGVYNYIRDVKDFTDLVSKAGVTLTTESPTQTAWEKGIDKFYTSHYSGALKDFETVKELYPNHAKVDEFIASAQKHIADGDDVVDFPLIPVIIIGVVVLLGAGAGVFLIIRHKKHHNVYQAGVAQGTVEPSNPAPQTVAVSPAAPTVEAPTAPAPVVEPVTPVEPAAPAPVPPAPSEPAAPPAPSGPAPVEPVSSSNPWFGPGNTTPDDPTKQP